MEDLAPTASQIDLENYLRLFAFRYEYEYIWQRKPSLSSICFLLNRYFALFCNATSIVLGFLTLNTESCSRSNLYHQITLIAQQILVCALLSIRIYAMYGCSRRVVVYMLSSASVLIILSCWSLFDQKDQYSNTFTGCHVALSRLTIFIALFVSMSLRSILYTEVMETADIASAWEALFVYDSILFGFTLYRSYKETSRPLPPNRQFTRGSRLISVIIRDGAIYFAVMALCNLGNILTFYLGPPMLRGTLSTFASCMAVTLISRLMLNLHKVAREGIMTTMTGAHDPEDKYSSIVFRSRHRGMRSRYATTTTATGLETTLPTHFTTPTQFTLSSAGELGPSFGSMSYPPAVAEYPELETESREEM
ncbi:hypothetical protein FISHEDRAFT_55766 [Fistulina hepatica ATCC 64428]|uniref:Uncharacterized protein n=1 Tax=Fistulina hepatica ATCC 64428 TaxID=1128425 RepID=A0A0D7ALQ9_9AGAR|nr:hypothetical protein FISHEDRAFT_55766 [Fistulina hepatica ATCC 64428]